MSEYEMKLQDFGLNTNQIEIIREILTEKVVGEYFSPDEYYPADPVEFLQAWEHEKDIGDSAAGAGQHLRPAFNVAAFGDEAGQIATGKNCGQLVNQPNACHVCGPHRWSDDQLRIL